MLKVKRERNLKEIVRKVTKYFSFDMKHLNRKVSVSNCVLLVKVTMTPSNYTKRSFSNPKINYVNSESIANQIKNAKIKISES